MIDKNQLEPEPKYRTCVYCFKTRRLRGRLIHWPSADADPKKLVNCNPFGAPMMTEPFSIWLYTCAWCRAAETKRNKRREKHCKEGKANA